MLSTFQCMKPIGVLLSILIFSQPAFSLDTAEYQWTAPGKEEKEKKEQAPALADSSLSDDCGTSMLRGKQDAAASHSSAGWKVGGFFCGLGLGLIGTGIITAAAAAGEPQPKAIPNGANVACYTDGYSTKAGSKNTWGAFGGGLFGTVVIVAVLLIASAD